MDLFKRTLQPVAQVLKDAVRLLFLSCGGGLDCEEGVTDTGCCPRPTMMIMSLSSSFLSPFTLM